MKPLESKGLILPFSPRRLISLADMIELSLSTYLAAESVVKRYFNECVCKPNGTDLTQAEKEGLLEDISNTVEPGCKRLRLSKSLSLITQLHRAVNGDWGNCDAKQVEARLLSLWHTMFDEASAIRFAFVLNENAHCFHRDRLFGKLVHKKFKQARKEIKAAGNCIAVGLNTAAVFHLMRVAEHGLRWLADKLHVTIVAKNKSIEDANWGDIISELEAQKKNIPRSRMEFYQEAIRTCDAIRFLWRNPVSHLRGDYSMAAAKAIYEDIKRFMQNLARGRFQ